MFERGIIIHHTAGVNDTFEKVRDYHMNHPDRMYSDIGYNHFIEKNGEVKVGRGMKQGAHIKGLNHLYYGVAFAGDFTREYPTDEQLRSGAQLVGKLLHGLRLQPAQVYGHGEIAKTTVCPGTLFDMKRFKTLVSRQYGLYEDLMVLQSNDIVNDMDLWYEMGDENLPVWAGMALFSRIVKKWLPYLNG